MLCEDIEDLEISLHDIDAGRLRYSELMLTTIAENLGRKVGVKQS